jgi:Cache domain
MATEGFDVRISLQRLLVGLILTIVPLSILGLYITARSDRLLQLAVGNHLKIIAESKAGQTGQFVNDLVVVMGALASAPSVREETAAADAAYRGASGSAIDSRTQSIQEHWDGWQSAPVVEKILSTRAARLLRAYRETDPRFLRITVTDATGAVVAATHKPARYFYGNDEQWQAVFAGGKGAIQLGDVKYDSATKTNYISVAMPVLEEGSSRVLGAAQALVDISPIATILNRGLVEGGTHASLVKQDGTIIFGPDVSLPMNLKAREYPAVNEAIGSVAGRATGYVVADVGGGVHNLAAFADTELKRDYQSLGWIVLVSQDEREASAPNRAVGWFAVLMAILGLLMTVIFGVYFQLHRRQRMTDLAALQEAEEEPVTSRLK